MVWSCLLFIRSGQNHLARHSERGKKTRRTKEEVERHQQQMDRPGVRQVPEGSRNRGKMEKTGYRIICGAPTTLAVKGLMMMMMMMTVSEYAWHLEFVFNAGFSSSGIKTVHYCNICIDLDSGIAAMSFFFFFYSLMHQITCPWWRWDDHSLLLAEPLPTKQILNFCDHCPSVLRHLKKNTNVYTCCIFCTICWQEKVIISWLLVSI